MSYLGSSLHRFWSRCGDTVHPDDKPFLDVGLGLSQDLSAKRKARKQANFLLRYCPCPFDGPLHSARVVICLANPNYPDNGDTFGDLIARQREGNQPLPREWDGYYQERIGDPLGYSMDALRHLVTVFNVCPYASKTMEGPEQRLAAGLPSVWAAQKHLREVLIPSASKGLIFLVVIRKHELWGITEGFSTANIAVTRGSELKGRIPKAVAAEIREWLLRKDHLQPNVGAASR